MHPHIERYIYAITKRLPQAQRDEVANDLRANLADMMGDTPKTDAEILEILRKLGHPRVLANNYRGKERTVVAPEYYDDYLNVLKVVATIVVVVNVVTGMISILTGSLPTDFVALLETIFENVFGNIWESLLLAFAWTTIGFWIAGAVDSKQHRDAWKISDLPELPHPNSVKISRIGVAFELIFGVSFGIIGLILISNGIPYFKPDVVQPFIPFVMIGIGLDVLIGLIKLVYGTWNAPVSIATFFHHLYETVLGVYFLRSGFIDPSLYQLIADNSEFSVLEVQNGFSTALTVLMWLIILGNSVEVIQAISKAIKVTFNKN
jgi:hypothetical protein